jgi:PAS domain S-box-containing protein
MEQKPRPERILIVDDCVDMRNLVKTLLQKRWTVSAVTDGLAALASIKADRPDLILTDMSMPLLGGVGLIQKLRADVLTKDIPVIVLSAGDSEDARLEGAHAGADDYVVKPFIGHELIARVRTQLELGRARAQAFAERRRFVQAFAQSSVGMAMVDKHGCFTSVNHAYAKMLGYGADEMLTRSLVDIIHPDHFKAADALVHQLVAAEIPTCISEHWSLRSDQSVVWTRNSISIVRDEAALDFQMIMVIEDITGRKQFEAERTAHLAELTRSVHTSELLTGVLAHDLRTPLAGIALAAQTLLRRVTDATLLIRVQRILKSAGRMARMVEQLLDVTHARLGRGIPLVLAPADLADLCHNVAAEVRTAHAACDVRVDVQGDAAGNWDGERLAQLLTNLIANAAQHRQPGTVVTVSIDGTASAHVICRVINAGAIAPTSLATLFDPFKENSRKSSGGSSGLGLGLFIGQQIVIAHGGTIKAASTDKGLVIFEVMLPRFPNLVARPVFEGAAQLSCIGESAGGEIPLAD